jgi:YHS domain-containing protein
VIVWLLRLVAWVLLLGWLWRLIRGRSGALPLGASTGWGGATRGRSDRGERLVRDPVCGVFVAPSRALTSGSGDARAYFCSERCRAEHARSRAAS